MTDVVTVGSPIEGGISVDLDEVRATPRADQWKHTDLLCGLIDHLRDELARTTGDLAVACEVARERAATSAGAVADRLAAAATVFLDEWRRGDDSITAGMAADLEDAIAEWGDAADGDRA